MRMDTQEMLLTIHDTVLNFPEKIPDPVIQFLPKQRFSRYLAFSPLPKHLNTTPCLVVETKGGPIISYCKEIIDQLTVQFPAAKKRLFLEAITLHELYHIRNRLRARNAEDAVFSEGLVAIELKQRYPQHTKVLREVKNQIRVSLIKV